ncbi:MAG: capsular biosynthesis protein [Desulfuromonas sp.]|nr:MAG: capsular biosynthesis protein [Desulfuromonas sp.]
MIDIHCHILPGIDDGPDDLATSLEMVRKAAEDGTRQLFATPHVTEFGPDPQTISTACTSLQEEVDKAGIPLQLHFGADVPSSLGPAGCKLYPLAGSRYHLLEFPHSHLPADAEQLIFFVVTSGLIPIITHPERNRSLIADPDRLEPLVAAGGLVQVTAASLLGSFGPDSRACSRMFLRHGLVHFLASDGHDPYLRPPVMSAGVKEAVRIIGPQANQLVNENPARILADIDWD